MAGGNFNPAPLRYGASSGTNLEAVLNELRQGVGTAFNVEPYSIVWIYLNAMSRVMNELFETNQKLINQWDPLRMTDFIERWEKILGLIAMPFDTLVDRRRKIEIKFQQMGQAGTQQMVQDLLINILGEDVFVEILINDPDTTNAAVPGGAVIPGGANIPDGDWFSDVSYLPILVEQPSYMDDLTFYQTVAQIFVFLDNLLPAWVTYDWIRNNSDGECGFILDELQNLDNEYFC